MDNAPTPPTYPALTKAAHKELLSDGGGSSRHLSTPRTDEDIAKLRDESLHYIFEDASPEDGVRFEELSAPGAFTCDECALVRACGWAFDPYNTRGDCLLDK